MRRGTLFLVAVLAAVIFFWMRAPLSSARKEQASDRSIIERTPVCPWREPPRDLLALFPPATNYAAETRILSGMMVPIRKRLGRGMTVDENPLRVFRVTHDGRLLGSVLVCRVKGEHGGIELVIGVDPQSTVRGLIIQSHREPEAVAQIITNSSFLAAFAGKNSSSPLRPGEDLPDVPPQARASAQAVADGVRSQLIVLSFAELPLDASPISTHTNH